MWKAKQVSTKDEEKGNDLGQGFQMAAREGEARERVIDSLHQEATMWTDRFSLTLNRSQELPRLLAKAKAMADTYSAPKKIHRLLSYCQQMIDLMDHMIRNR